VVPTLAQKTKGDLVTCFLYEDDALTSSAGGVVSNVFTTNPNTAINWSSFAGIYDEYRVLALHIEYLPSNRYNKSNATLVAPGYIVIDTDDTGAITVRNDAATYTSKKFVSLEMPWSMTYRMSTTENSQFITTASPISTSCFKLFFDNLTAAAFWGSVALTYVVQFKGRE
jgi:hypothetical protein